MSKDLENRILNHFNKFEIVNYVNSDSAIFDELIKFSFSDDNRLAWRATWIIGQCIHLNDNRIKPFIGSYIDSLINKKEGHQREILKLLEKMQIEDDLLGKLFDICISIWKDVDKIPSVRITAFRILVDIAEKYNELVNEIELFVGKIYSKTLSEGIKGSFENLKKQLLLLKYK